MTQEASGFVSELTLDFRVAYDGADDLERLSAGLLDAHVRVAEHLDELRHDGWQARGQLLRRAVRHCTQQLDRTCTLTTFTDISKETDRGTTSNKRALTGAVLY